MAKGYSVGGDGLALLASAQTIIAINPYAAVGPPLTVMRMWVSQAGSNTGVQQRVQITTQPSTFPVLVSATPRHLDRTDTVASLLVGATSGAAGTVGITATSEGGGSRTVTFGDNFNTLNGFLTVYTPPEAMKIAPGDANNLTLFFPIAVTSTSTWAVGVNYLEGPLT